MKILKSIIFLAFIASSSSALAKESAEIIPLTKSEKNKSSEDTKIEPFDFQKLFSEAENYYKLAKAWEKIKCEPKSGFICTKRECAKRDAKAFVILDKKKKTISRCEGDKCEEFPAQFKQTGVYFNVQTEGPIGTLIRVLGDNRYKEITTIGLDAYIANGNCEVLK